MRDTSLFIVTLGAFLVNVCSCIAQNFERNTGDEPLGLASDALVVKTFQDEGDLVPTEEVEYQSYQGVMGRPGIDFPVYGSIPATNFNCRDVKRPGYYADLGTDCQVFHICEGGRKISFLCPNGTIFRQSHLICDWWFRVDCGKSVELYEESAEQLAADQKIYRARSIERERRKKLGKGTQSEEQTSPGGEALPLDEPFDAGSRTLTSQFDGNRKTLGERHSKKVLDSRAEAKFPSYQRPEAVENEKSGGGAVSFAAKTKLSKLYEIRNHNVQSGVGANANSHQPPNLYTTEAPIYPSPQYKTRAAAEKATKSWNNRENIEGAESGGFFGNFRNSVKNGNSLLFDSKASQFRINVPTTTSEHPYFAAQKKYNEARRQSYSPATTTPATTTGRDLIKNFYDATSGFNRHYQPQRSYYSIRATTKPTTAEAHQTAEPVRFITTTLRPQTTTWNYQTQQFAATTHRYLPAGQAHSSTETPFKYRQETAATTERTPPEEIHVTTTGSEASADPATTAKVDVHLREVTINKANSESTEETRSYDDAAREGLNIPPSSGPNALRSFALYFASKNSDGSKKGIDTSSIPRDLFYIPTVREEKETSGAHDEKAKDLVKEVDTIIRGSSGKSDEEPLPLNALPNELTQQTKDSYSALFGLSNNATDGDVYPVTEADYGTTALEQYTEDADKINRQLKNDLDISQSRGLVEPEAHPNAVGDSFDKGSSDLRELAQVFTKALSAYLDDPQGFRKILTGVRPTEPSSSAEASTGPSEYPSVTQEDDEVLDFSDVTKSSHRKKTTTGGYGETTTEYQTEPPTTTGYFDNVVLPLSASGNHGDVKIPETELTAPLLESLDQSQSSYYTPPPSPITTTNPIAEEINSEFSGDEQLPEIDSNEAVDSYFPVKGSVDDKSLPRYGGFQNNTRTTKYRPYGSELTTKSYVPDEDVATTAVPEARANTDDTPTTFNPSNITASIHFRKAPEPTIKNRDGEEVNLARELNKLALPEQSRTLIIVPPVPEIRSVELGNGETAERARSEAKAEPPQETEEGLQSRELSRELIPPLNSEPSDGYYGFGSALGNNPQASPNFHATTTYGPTTMADRPIETPVPTLFTPYEGFASKLSQSGEEPSTTPAAATSESFQRIAELQQTLMFNGSNVTRLQMETVRDSVAEAMDSLNMTDSTANALMKMMEMAAKNETYRRLVLLLVNDKSGKNKTVEEARLALLRALLTPVISTTRARHLDAEPAVAEVTASTTQEPRRRGSYRRQKSISNGATRNYVSERSRSGRRSKGRNNSRVAKTTETPTTTIATTTTTTTTSTSTTTTISQSNLELLKQTIENSQNKEVKNNALDDAILDSDSRAIELLKSLYTLAARWG